MNKQIVKLQNTRAYNRKLIKERELLIEIEKENEEVDNEHIGYLNEEIEMLKAENVSITNQIKELNK